MQTGTIQMRRTNKESWLTVRVRIVTDRNVYGRLERLVTPVEGAGEMWVNDTSVTPDPEPTP
jgi:hypothetical protein